MVRYLLVFILLISNTAFAAVYTGYGKYVNDDVNQTILFVNGIKNDLSQAQSSSLEISKLLGWDAEKNNFNFTYFFNPTEGFISDTIELSVQSEISSLAMQAVGGNSVSIKTDDALKTNYYLSLGKKYTLNENNRDAFLTEANSLKNDLLNPVSQGKRDRLLATVRALDTAFSLKNKIETILNKNIQANLVIVPHSQGNFYTEAAYAILMYENKQELLKRIRVVGVASVAGSTPNNTYLSGKQDNAVFVGQSNIAKSFPPYTPLPFNETGCYFPCTNWLETTNVLLQEYTGDIALHGFGEIYLSDKVISTEKRESYRLIIREYIYKFMTDLRNLVDQPVSTPPLNGYWLTKCFDDDQNGLYFQQLMDVSLVNNKIHIAQKVRRNYGADSTCKGVFSTEPASSETLSDVLVSTNIQGGDTIYTFKNPDGSTYTVTVNTATLTLSDDPIASPFTRQPSFAFPTQSTLNWKTNPANNHLYTVLSCGNWTQCEKKAIELGGHLVTVNDAAENKWLVDTYSTNPNLVQGPWIGLSDADNEGVWKWASGENISYSNWYSGEPNNSFGRSPEGEDYGHILLQTGNWNDIANFSDYGGVNQTSWAIIEKLN